MAHVHQSLYDGSSLGCKQEVERSTNCKWAVGDTSRSKVSQLSSSVTASRVMRARSSWIFCIVRCSERFEAADIPPSKNPFGVFRVEAWTPSNLSGAGMHLTVVVHNQQPHVPKITTELRELFTGAMTTAVTFRASLHL